MKSSRPDTLEVAIDTLGDLPNAHGKKWVAAYISWGKTVHPSVARATPLMIGKLIRNPNSNLQTGLKYILMKDLLPEILCNN
jgi:hypothetical protein